MFNLHGNRRPRPVPLITLAAAIGVGVAIIVVGASAHSATDRQSAIDRQSSVYSRSTPRLVQDTDVDTDSEVPSDQVEKYVAVYKDMQRNRSLTVETAAAKEGLSVAEFRELERKIGRDDAAREHVRTELQAAAAEKP
jgi:hypothetical protein